MSSWVTGEVQPPVTICQLKSRIIVGHEERRFANVANSEGNTQGLQWWCAHLWGTVLVFIFKWKNWAKRKEEFVIMQSWWRRVCLIIVSLWSKGVVQGSPHFLAQAGSAGMHLILQRTASHGGWPVLGELYSSWSPCDCSFGTFISVSLTLKEEERTQ